MKGSSEISCVVISEATGAKRLVQWKMTTCDRVLVSDSPNVLDDQLIFSAPFRSLSHQASWLLPTSAALNLSPRAIERSVLRFIPGR